MIHRTGMCAVMILVLVVGICQAGGISTPCSSMYLGNLKIGQEYSLKALLGYPFNITYKGRWPIDLSIDVLKPGSDEKLADGFVPVPDTTWVRVQRSDFALEPGETAETDVIISIPNDESLLGRKFMVYLRPRTSAPRNPYSTGGGMLFSTALICYLRLDIAPKPPTPEEIRILRKQRYSGYMTVSVTPDRVFLNDLEPGKRYDLGRQFNEFVKVVNATPKPVDVTLEVVRSSAVGILVPEGMEEPADLRRVSFSSRRFKAKRDSIKSIGISADTSSLILGGRYFVVARVHVSNEHLNINHYIKFYIDMKRPPLAE